MNQRRPDIYWKSSEDMTESEVESGSVQSVITSPPYYDLKDYGHENEIGVTDASYEQYQSRLKTVWSECYDKLNEYGTLWAVVDTTMLNGNLKLIPHHIKNAAEDLGFHYQDTIVWYKPTALGGLNPKNLVNKKEYIVFLSKGKNPKIYPDRNSVTGTEDPAVSDDSRIGNLWRFPVKRGSLGKEVLHKAPYPVDLVKRMVEISTDEGDKVLDPFLGSGTTACAALELDREFVGYEINEDFEDVIQDRLSYLPDIDSSLTKWSQS